MMAPTIILEPDGTVTALGTGGSNRIRTAILQVAVDLLDRGMGLEEAVEAPRLHVEKCGTLSFEPGFPEEARARLPRARRQGACLARAAICSSAGCMPRAASPMAGSRAPAIRAAAAVAVVT